MSPAPPTTTGTPRPPANGGRRSRRRWLRRLLLSIATLAVVLPPLLNGPIFRSIVHWQLGKVFHDLYLDGEFVVDGTLLRGLQLRDVELAGTRNLRYLKIRRADIDYQLLPLTRGAWGEGVTRVHASHIDSLIDNSKSFPRDPEIEARKAERRAKKARKDKPAMLWENLDSLLQQDLQIDDLNLTITSDADPASPPKPVFSLSGFAFDLHGGNGSIGADHLSLPNGQETSGLSARLATTGTPIIQIQSLGIADDLTIDRLAVTAPSTPGGIPVITGEIQFLGGQITATQDSPSRWIASLASGSIDLKSLGTWLEKDFGISGSIDQIDATFDRSAATPIRANITAQGITYQEFSTDTTTAAIAYSKDQLLVESLTVTAGKNILRLTGGFDTATKDAKAEASLDAPDLPRIAQGHSLPDLAGTLTAHATIELVGGKLTNSTADINATDLIYEAAPIANTTLHASSSAPDILDFTFESDIDGSRANTLTASGTFDIATTNYDAKADLKLPDLSSLHPILEAINVSQRPTGNLDLAWNGAGCLREKSHRGSATIPGFDADLGQGNPVSGKLNLDYAPGTYSLTNLTAKSDAITITGDAHLADNRLDVGSLHLSSGDIAIARAEVSIPFDTGKLSDLNAFLAQPGPVSIQIDSNKLKLSDLVAMAGQPAPIAATLDSKIDIHGTLDAPVGTGKFALLQIRSARAADLAPADLNLDLQLGDGQLSLDGILTHPEIQPITISGHSPLHLQELAGLPARDIKLDFHLPETRLELAKKYLPDLTHAEGTISADIRIAGTTDAPTLTGDLRADCPLLKFKEQAFPTLSDLAVAIHLEERRLLINTFRGYLAGGEITIGGDADLTSSLTNPELNLSLQAKQALIIRDDNLSLRTNADLHLTGPFQSASLNGGIGITQSRFFREIEILPIGLPKSSPTPGAPAAPSFNTKREIGITAKPFSDWTVDVHIVTDDPFLIRSNLARGDVVSDLLISGTGRAPIPSGTVTLQNGIATLPFSQLETTGGTLTFSPATGFDPEIDFRAHSKVQAYEIKLFAYGRASDPKTLITSDPPLPESEAVSLLATGSKSSDFSNRDVIAGDAALLLIDKLRRKYAKGTPLERRPGDLRDLLSFKAGQIDPRSGKRAASASLEVTDNVFLLGNVDVEGEYRGLVKFIFRFK